VKRVALLALGILVAGAVQAEPEFHDLTCHLHYAEVGLLHPRKWGMWTLGFMWLWIVLVRTSPVTG
jgi:hypothetical protein